MPSIKESWAKKNTTRDGIMEINDIANTRFHSNPVSPSMDIFTKMDAGYLDGLFTYNSGPIKSLDDHINWNNAQDTIDGFNIGTITYHSVFTLLHPSIFAAS